MASVAKKASNIVVWILLGLLFVALAGFGVTSFSGGSRQVAEVGRANVTASAYFRLIQQTINQQIAATGQPVRLADLQADRVDEAIRPSKARPASMPTSTRQRCANRALRPRNSKNRSVRKPPARCSRSGCSAVLPRPTP